MIQTALSHLQTTTRQILPLAGPEWDDFAAIWQPFEAKRKVILTAEGDTEKYVYFVLEGVQRAYAVGDDGRESTLVFTYPFSFSGVADSFLLQQPSRYFFETLTPSAFLRSTFRQLDEVMLRHHAVERMLRLAVSHTLAGVLVRQIELQSFTAEQRFRSLMKRSPHILQLVPHKYLASYLGMDATNFSKFLGNIRL
ncbi:MAG TPA: cyclic nucleotide-binding domain-containing protein [Saprospiraceae bacterium]|nr:cyclic nucleotide-binding domain-containing protein [Saprospiraceae bacterium]